MQLSEKTVSEISSILNNTVSDSKAGIPGTTFVVVSKDGSELLAQSAGKRGVVSKEPMDLDSIYWIASCTKMLTGLSCMQLVEKGILNLDDVEQVEGLCPELKEIKVLKMDGTLEPKKNGITLRMLLTHTAGFSYSFFHEGLRDWSLPVGASECSGRQEDVTMLPLVFQPGEGWEYGVGIDWAGIVLEKKTGIRLNDYIQKNICQPLGLENVNMIPTKSMKDHLAHMHWKISDGKLLPRDHLMREPLMAATKEEMDRCFHSGGAGMFAKPQEYARVLQVLMNDGTDPKTGAQLLEKSTVDEMFRNQIPQFPDFSHADIPASKPDLTNPIPVLHPNGPENAQQGWGLTFMLTGSPAGRSATSAFWAGLSNCFWWCDRENGVAAMICTQILPFADPHVLGTMFELEAAVYRGLGIK